MTKCFLCIMIRAEQSQLVLLFLCEQQTAVAGKRSQPGVLQMLVVLLSCCGCPLGQVFWGIRLKKLLPSFNLCFLFVQTICSPCEISYSEMSSADLRDGNSRSTFCAPTARCYLCLTLVFTGVTFLFPFSATSRKWEESSQIGSPFLLLVKRS